MSAIRFVKLLAEHGVHARGLHGHGPRRHARRARTSRARRPGRGVGARDHPVRRHRAARRPRAGSSGWTRAKVVGVIVGRALYEKSFTLAAGAGASSPASGGACTASASSRASTSRDGRVVKGVNFVDIRDAGDPVELAARYDAEGADELVFLDITASHERRDIIVDLAARCAEQVFIPFTIGGGLAQRGRRARHPRRRRRQGHRSTPPPCEDPELDAPLRASGSARSASWWRSTRAASRGPGRRGAAALGGLRPRRAHADGHRRRRVGARGRPSSAPARSCSPAWTATARCDGYDLELTRAVARGGRRPGHRLRRRRARSSTSPTASPRARPTPCSRPASSTTAPTRSREAKEYLAARGVPVRPVAPVGRAAARPDAEAAASVSGARRIDLAGPDGADAPRLAGLLAAARLVCFPTDTVYGVGGLVTPAVREAVVAAKGREAGKPLQVVYPTVELLEAVARAGARAPRRRASAAARAVHAAAAVPAGPGLPAGGRGAAPHAGRVGRQGRAGRHARRARARVARGRAGARRAARSRCSPRAPTRAGARRPGPWTRWTAACWPPATSSSTPGR